MMDYWPLTGLSNDQISKAFLTSIEEEITQLKTRDLEKFGEEKNPVLTHEKVCALIHHPPIPGHYTAIGCHSCHNPQKKMSRIKCD